MSTFLIFLLLVLLASSANAEPYPWDLVKDGKFNKAYKAALGPKAKDPWLTKLDGPSEEGKKVKVGGKEYLFVHSCKQHACDTTTWFCSIQPKAGTCSERSARTRTRPTSANRRRMFEPNSIHSTSKNSIADWFSTTRLPQRLSVARFYLRAASSSASPSITPVMYSLYSALPKRSSTGRRRSRRYFFSSARIR